MPWNLFGAKEAAPAKAEREEVRDKDMVRVWQRNLRQEMRVIDRQIRKIQSEEDKIVREVKKSAWKGEMWAVKIHVKTIARSKWAVSKMYTTKTQLNSISMEVASMSAQMKMANSMKMSATVMKHMNAAIKVPEIQSSMQEMQREMMKAGLIQEVMDDAMESMEDDDIDVLADQEMAGVLEELAIEGLAEMMNPSWAGKIPWWKAKTWAASSWPKDAAPTKEEEDLIARLDAL